VAHRAGLIVLGGRNRGGCRSGRDDAPCAEFDAYGDSRRVFVSISSSVDPRGANAVLRPWVAADAEAVVDAFRDPDIQRWHVRRAGSVDESRQWINAWQAGWADEAQLSWALVDCVSDSLMGRVSLKGVDLHDGAVGMAYWMVPAFRGRGLWLQAVHELSQGLQRRGFPPDRVGAFPGEPDIVPGRVKAGFHEEGIRRSAAPHAGPGWLESENSILRRVFRGAITPAIVVTQTLVELVGMITYLSSHPWREATNHRSVSPSENCDG
jgi:[ribosomal protein S5]-alanine N-acetyltransferase